MTDYCPKCQNEVDVSAMDEDGLCPRCSPEPEECNCNCDEIQRELEEQIDDLRRDMRYIRQAIIELAAALKKCRDE